MYIKQILYLTKLQNKTNITKSNFLTLLQFFLTCLIFAVKQKEVKLKI